MKRTDAREMIMQLIFQMEAQKDFSSEARITYRENNFDGTDQEAYFDKIMDTFLENRTAIDAQIEEASNKWHLGRMGKVDLAVLRVALTELKLKDDIPQSVAINEAVNMAKKFGSEESGKFVNGLLGNIVKA